MSRKPTLKLGANGLYSRQIGYLPGGGQPKFYLGGDQRAAQTRNDLLERLWAVVRARQLDLNEDPAWDAVTLDIARAVARGEGAYPLRPNPEFPPGEAQAHWFARYADLVAGVIRVVPANPEVVDDGLRVAREGRRAALVEAARRVDAGYPDLDGDGGRLPTGQTLHQALDAYVGHLRETLRDPSGQRTDWGTIKPQYANFLKVVTADCDLADLTTQRIDRVIDLIRRRPPARTHAARKAGGKPVSAKYAKTCIGLFRHFLKWLHRADGWRWRRPEDYEVTPVRVEPTAEERAKRGRDRVPTYTVDELKILWRYARPYERLLLALGLNCGFAPREIATLCRDEVMLRRRHPEADRWNMPSGESDGWVMRSRRKTLVYGEWRLWPVTVRAIGWYAAHRPESDSEYLFLTKEGRPLFTRTKGENQNRRVANTWSRLLDRVGKDEPGFRRLPFKTIRKTSANWIRQRFGEELSSLFLSHGRPSTGDETLDDYTNPRFAALHEALARLDADHYSRVWEGVSDPFPAAWVRGGPNISRETIERIQALAVEGKKPGEIAHEVGVSRETARRWMKRSTS